MQFRCVICDLPCEAKSPRAKYCGETCRKRKVRGSAVVVPPPQVEPSAPADTTLVDAVRVELTAAGRLESVLGQSALRLAEKMCGFDTGSGLAALNRELRATMAEALQNAVVSGDLVDEVKARRDAKRAAAG